MITLKQIQKYDDNLGTYLKRMEEVENTRLDCPWLTNSTNTVLGIAEKTYSNFINMSNAAIDVFNKGIDDLFKVWKAKENGTEITKKDLEEIDRYIEKMDGLDIRLDAISKAAKGIFIPFYKNTASWEKSVQKLYEYGLFKK